jgi:hypothetical protein
MKKVLIISIALLPLALFAGNAEKEKNKKGIDIRISSDKDGKLQKFEITGLDGNEMKQLEKDINEALKDVSIKIDDGKEKHEIHFKAELKID